jgi:hypothetical protein
LVNSTREVRMVKKVLAVHFSQTGQAAAVLANGVAPLRRQPDIGRLGSGAPHA